MKKLITLAAILIAATTSAGTLKLPGSNITRNAGTSIPVTIQASGFPAGSSATVSLVRSGTWVVTPWLFDVPIINGNNPIQIPVDWSFLDVGNYLVKVNVGNNHCTSTWVARIRSAVIWPYGASIFYRGAGGAVTFVLPPWAEYISVYLQEAEDGRVYGLIEDGDGVDLYSGRWDFAVPTEAAPGTYRIWINCYGNFPVWDDYTVEWYWESMLLDSTKSERITIR